MSKNGWTLTPLGFVEGEFKRGFISRDTPKESAEAFVTNLREYMAKEWSAEPGTCTALVLDGDQLKFVCLYRGKEV